MEKRVMRRVLGIGALVALGACSKNSAQNPPVDTEPLRAAITRIFGGALVSEPRADGSGSVLVFRYAGGRIQVDATRHHRGYRLRVKATGIALENLDPSGMLRGSVEAEGTLTTSGEVAPPVGEITLRCVSCTLGGVKVGMTLRGKAVPHHGPFTHVTIPTLSVGRLSCRVELAAGRATFRQCSARSADVKAELTGALTLRDPFRDSTVQAALKIGLSEALMTREPKWRAIESALPGMREGGSRVLTLRGRLFELRWNPSRPDHPRGPRVAGAPPTPRAPAQAESPLPANAIRQLGPRRFAVDVPSVVQRLTGGATGRLDFSLMPRVERGARVGFELRNSAPGSLPARLGLQDGDVLVHVNAVPLTSPEGVLELYTSTTGPGPWVLTLLRGGRRLTVSYERLRSP